MTLASNSAEYRIIFKNVLARELTPDIALHLPQVLQRADRTPHPLPQQLIQVHLHRLANTQLTNKGAF